MNKYSIESFFRVFAAETLKGLPTTHPLYLDFKKVYFKAARDILSFQHDVLGDKDMHEDAGAIILQGFIDETDHFFKNMPGAKKQADGDKFWERS